MSEPQAFGAACLVNCKLKGAYFWSFQRRLCFSRLGAVSEHGVSGLNAFS